MHRGKNRVPIFGIRVVRMAVGEGVLASSMMKTIAGYCDMSNVWFEKSGIKLKSERLTHTSIYKACS